MIKIAEFFRTFNEVLVYLDQAKSVYGSIKQPYAETWRFVMVEDELFIKVELLVYGRNKQKEKN